jgi:hypothetical protein
VLLGATVSDSDGTAVRDRDGPASAAGARMASPATAAISFFKNLPPRPILRWQSFPSTTHDSVDGFAHGLVNDQHPQGVPGKTALS